MNRLYLSVIWAALLLCGLGQGLILPRDSHQSLSSGGDLAWRELALPGASTHPRDLSRRDPDPPAGEQPDPKFAEQAGLQRFEQVGDFLLPGDRLFRSSAPHYANDRDDSQRLTPDSIEFLKKNGIKLVISMNSQAKNPEMVEAFKNAGIEYLPLPTEDYQAPTQKDFKSGYEAFKRHRSGTLVWCGFGWGRTGTMVSALQASTQNEQPSPKKLEDADFEKNHVEREWQKAAVRKLQKKPVWKKVWGNMKNWWSKEDSQNGGLEGPKKTGWRKFWPWARPQADTATPEAKPDDEGDDGPPARPPKPAHMKPGANSVPKPGSGSDNDDDDDDGPPLPGPKPAHMRPGHRPGTRPGGKSKGK
ncbi:hypothetical protein HIM_05700 [Hirsutella minnesotensis 3608]|uniref:Swiss Army Knife protein DSP-PTPase phosphatase domain-containing protein n=1 Tax=Hirsutella minnesotensis 3608 TaxID=1043627 RepID=A0A0F8A5A1_9HYPO|nr:hypothetical protein HIM_05700 [Hirsutella minnesotensis 3608]